MNSNDRGYVGGKAAALGEIICCKLSVPFGFVVSVEVLNKALINCDDIKKDFQNINFDNIESVSNFSQKIIQRILQLAVPEDSQWEILNALKQLDGEYFAVRSSAPEEDGDKFSWAGQFETQLGVTRSGILVAIKRCWASAFSPAALTYRKYLGKEKSFPEMAVIVQRMVDSDYAGVAFSIDPISGADDRIFIECVRGLGEGLVSGKLTPSRYEIGKRKFSIINTVEVDQPFFLSISKDNQGGVSCIEHASKARTVLPHSILQSLCVAVERLENHFSQPVDVEWATEGEKIYITQARPVSAAAKEQSFAEVFASRQSKLKLEFSWAENHSVISGGNWLKSYLYYRHYPANECQYGLSYVSKGYVTTYFCEQDRSAAYQEGAVLCDPQQFRLHLKRSNRARERFAALYEEFRQLDCRLMSNHDLLSIFHRYQGLSDELWALYKLSQPEYTEFAENRLRTLLAQHLPQEDLENLVIAASAITEFDIVKEEEMALYDLALKTEISEQDIENHAEKYAWLLFNTFDRNIARHFINSRIGDLKSLPRTQILDCINNLKRSITDALEQRDEVLARVGNEEVSYLGAVLSELALDRYRLKTWWGGAEYRFLTLVEEIANRIGISVTDLLYSYRVRDFEDFLTKGKKLPPSVIESRKDNYAVFLCGDKYYWYEGKDAVFVHHLLVNSEKVADTNNGDITGTIANVGLARGKVRVLRVEGLERLISDMKEMQEGEILITTMTQPTMFSLARKAAAIVTNEGGVTSHAAIIARELGKPCIVGTRIATERFSNGDLVEVDANLGIVRKLDS